MNPYKTIVETCLALKQYESFLVIYDENKKDIAELILEASKKISHSSDSFQIPVGKINGEEPSEEASKKMLEYDVIVFATTKSLSWTQARMDATEKGARIGSMPGITQDIIERAIDVDYEDMKAMTNKIADVLDKGKQVRVTTQLGTDITFDIFGRDAHGRKAGFFTEKGDWGNLPEAEAFISPVEGKTNGVYIVDASQAGVGKIVEPIKITVKDGFAVSVEGGKKASEFKQMLDDVNDKNAFNIAELGIGTNKKAKVIGVVLEDEKVYGTAHIALGKNKGFGGMVDVPIHVDGVFNKPTIYVDEKMIMKDGELMI